MYLGHDILRGDNKGFLEVRFLAHCSNETKQNSEEFCFVFSRCKRLKCCYVASKQKESACLFFFFALLSIDITISLLRNMLWCLVFADTGDPDLNYTDVTVTQEVETANRRRGGKKKTLIEKILCILYFILQATNSSSLLP